MHRQVQVSWFVCEMGAGTDCYRGMQDCFRAHPEMYPSELEDEEDEIEEELRTREGTGASGEAPTKSTPEPTPQAANDATPEPTEPKKATEAAPHRDSSSTTAEVEQAGDEGGKLVPRAAHNASK